MILYGYYRSSAAWRVRAALALKGLGAEPRSRHLRKGEQKSDEFLAINPQGLLPALVTEGGAVLTQSIAICEWLEETHPTPPLLPADPLARARVRAVALAIACDIHPLQNIAPLGRLRRLGVPEDQVTGWARDVINEGLTAVDALLRGEAGPFCFGAAPSLADLCLVPQMFNARRFGCEVNAWPRLLAAEAACLALPAFAETAPDRQPDAE